MPAMAGREETWLVWEKRNPGAATSSLGSCSSPRDGVLLRGLGEGVLACTDIAALVKGCDNSAHPLGLTLGPLPSPVSHVHLVEGLLGQQGLHQRPGHGCVVCVAQCFCREGRGQRWSCRARGWRLRPPAHAFYLLLPEGLKSASHSHPVSRALSHGIFDSYIV